MHNHEYNYQEYWHQDIDTSHARSRLYPLKALYEGTANVESLTSYITRLAGVHQVATGVLLAQEVAPFIDKCSQSSRLSTRFYSTFFHQTGAWNGTGTMAVEPVTILQKLTQQSNLRFLTLLTWAPVLSTRQLIRETKAWCPLCYSDLSQHQIPLYEPLLWSISTIKVCLKHKQVLLSKCPNCGENINYLSWNSRSGFCSQCHQWLGLSCHLDDNIYQTEHDWQWQYFVIQEISNILASAPYLMQVPQKDKIAAGIDLCISSYANGQAKAFADLMYLSSTVPSDWRYGRALPALTSLLRVCYRLSISLIDFLTGNVKIDKKEILKELPLCQQQRKTNRPFDLSKVENLLLIALSESPPKSIKHVASEMGYDLPSLYRHFPNLCHEISVRYKSYKTSQPNQGI
jgi:TniQ